MQNKPLVSVFIPYYNDEEFLRDSIESVLNQTYENFELILLNHASTDSSRALAHSYNDSRIMHIDVHENLGAGSAVLMNEFLNVAQGKYAKLFCADDIMRPNCVETLVNYMESEPEIDIIYADMEYIDKEKLSLNTTWSKERKNFNFYYNEIETLRMLFDGCGILPYPSSIVKMDALKAVKKDPTFIMLVDRDIWAKLIVQGKKIKYVRDILVDYRIHNSQTASSFNKGRVYARSYFESLKYIELFNEIKDVRIIKYLCDNVPFINEITQSDEKFFPFILAYNNLEVHRPFPYRTQAYLYIHSLLMNPVAAAELKSRFGFGIKELRELYSVPWHKEETDVKDLKLRKLSFLWLRRLWKKLTLQDKKKKEVVYTE